MLTENNPPVTPKLTCNEQLMQAEAATRTTWEEIYAASAFWAERVWTPEQHVEHRLALAPDCYITVAYSPAKSWRYFGHDTAEGLRCELPARWLAVVAMERRRMAVPS